MPTKPMASELREARMQMLREILPSTVNDIHMAVIDLDITMLSVADILRNIHRTFPENGTMRNAICNGKMAVAVLCKTNMLRPFDGMVIIVTNDGTNVDIRSKSYIVLGVSEGTISSDEKILDMLDSFTMYLIKNYAKDMPEFQQFYSLYIYDAYELEEDEINHDSNM